MKTSTYELTTITKLRKEDIISKELKPSRVRLLNRYPGNFYEF